MLVEREHRIASYHKGCRCDQCSEAGRNHGRRYRDRDRDARVPQPGDKKCEFCGRWFHPKGIATHLIRCIEDL